MTMVIWLSSLVVVLFLMTAAEAAYYHCYSTGNFTVGSGYGNTRDGFLRMMSTDVKTQGGFDYFSSVTFSNTTDQQFCLVLCRADLIGSDACSNCVSNSTSTIINNCPVQMEVVAWGADAGCIIRCAPHDFSDEAYEEQPAAHSCNASEVPSNNLLQFRDTLAKLTSSVAERATEDGSKSYFHSEASDFPNYFATEDSKLLGDVGLTIYALGLCLPTLSHSRCVDCLQAAGNKSERLCNGNKGATIFTPICILRYELYNFYEPYSLVSPLSSPPPPPLAPASSPSHVRKEGRNRTLVTAVVLPVIMIIVLTVTTFIICIVNNDKRKTKPKGADREGDEIGAESKKPCTEFSIDTIRVATNNFSIYNKLGQGGFGVVYKGSLPSGHQIAVKRLAVHSARGDVEFKNEVQLVARLHHKNLIRLIGYCLHGKERILIYELAHNGSLDHFLFHPMRREQLDWKIRFNIIEGITRGMLYLHDESQLRIIHRDLKAGNILLDETMNAKISDFGTARLFDEDQGSASRIVGTYGYMAPEYVKHGKISVKIDVFSFGVLLLEIVCGKKNSASENPNHIEHQLSKVWKYWMTGKLLTRIDPILLRGSGQTDEITRCIHIGLLCVQEDPTCRPTMNSVILMLECCSLILPAPLKPAYFMLVEDDEPNAPMMDQDYSVSTYQPDSFSSVNEVSITQPYPEPR